MLPVAAYSIHGTGEYAPWTFGSSVWYGVPPVIVLKCVLSDIGHLHSRGLPTSFLGDKHPLGVFANHLRQTSSMQSDETKKSLTLAASILSMSSSFSRTPSILML